MNKLRLEHPAADLTLITLEPLTAQDVLFESHTPEPATSFTTPLSCLEQANAFIWGYIKDDVAEAILKALSNTPNINAHVLRTVTALSKTQEPWNSGMRSDSIREAVAFKGCDNETLLHRYNAACKRACNAFAGRESELKATLLADINDNLQRVIKEHNGGVHTSLTPNSIIC